MLRRMVVLDPEGNGRGRGPDRFRVGGVNTARSVVNGDPEERFGYRALLDTLEVSRWPAGMVVLDHTALQKWIRTKKGRLSHLLPLASYRPCPPSLLHRLFRIGLHDHARYTRRRRLLPMPARVPGQPTRTLQLPYHPPYRPHAGSALNRFKPAGDAKGRRLDPLEMHPAPERQRRTTVSNMLTRTLWHLSSGDSISSKQRLGLASRVRGPKSRGS